MNPYFPGNFGSPQNPFAGGGSPDGILLRQMAQGFAPVMSMPQQQMRTGFENLPGFSSPGLAGLAMNMFVAPQLQQQMSNYGMLPGGLSGQNVLDQMQVRRFQDEQQEMLSRMAQDYTPQGVTSTLRGMAALAGSEFDAPQQAAAARLGSTMATAAPLLAQLYPNQLDAMAGRSGSAVVMAQRMSEVNRFRTDPVTGLTGFKAESSEQLARDVFDNLFSSENMDDMRGIRAGDVGDLYGQMTARGMIAGDPRNRVERFQEAANFAGQDPGARARILETLGSTGDPIPLDKSGNFDLRQATQGQMDALSSDQDIATQARAFESDRVSNSIKGYVEVVSSMREIFGDFGRSDAPMAELVQGLEALSQGGLSQVGAGQLNQMVRTTSQLAQSSGMTLDAAFAMQQQASQGLEANGLNRVMSSQMTQGAMSFGQAMTATGANATPAFGLGSSDELRQLDQNLRVSAAASPMANSFGAILRAREELGSYAEGSEAEALSQALMTGQGQYIHNGKVVDIGDVDPNKIAGMMASGNEVMNLADARAFITNKEANQEEIFKNDLGNLVREEVQPDRVREKLLNDTTRQTSRSFLRRVEGFEDRDTREAASRDIGDAIDSTLANMTDADRRDPEIRRQAMQDAIKAAAPGLSDDQARFLAVDSFNEIQRRAKQDFGAHGSFENLMTVMNQNTLDQGQNVRLRETLEAGIKNDLSGLSGSGGVMERAIAAIQKAGTGDEREAELGKVLAEAFGGVVGKDIQEQMRDSFGAFGERQASVKKAQEALFALDPDDPGRNDALQNLEKERVALRGAVSNLREDMESNGLIDQEAHLDLTDVQEFREAGQVNRSNRSDLMMKLRGSSKKGIDTEVGKRLLAAENVGLAPGDVETINQMRDEVQDSLGTEATDEQRIKADEEFMERINSGNLNDEEKNKIIRSRQDRIDTRADKKEVDGYLRDQGFEDKEGRSNRAFVAELKSAQKRFVQAGMDRKDLDEKFSVTDEEIDAFILESNADLTGVKNLEDVRNDVAAVLRQEKFTDAEIIRQSSSSRGSREMAARYDVLEQRGAASTLRSAEQEKMDRTRTLVNDALLDPSFFEKSGGRGLASARNLRSGMEEMTRLSMSFAGGDLARLTTGSIDITNSTVRRRLGQLASSRADEVFVDGVLAEEFAVGDLADVTHEQMFKTGVLDADGKVKQSTAELQALLGKSILARDVQGLRENLDKQATFLGETVRRDGLAGLTEVGGSVRRLMNIPGGDAPQGPELETARKAQAFETARLTLGLGGTTEDAFNLAMKPEIGPGLKNSLSEDEQKRVTELGNAIDLVDAMTNADMNQADNLLIARNRDAADKSQIFDQLTNSGMSEPEAKEKADELFKLKGDKFENALGETEITQSAQSVLVTREKQRNTDDRQKGLDKSREILGKSFDGVPLENVLASYSLFQRETNSLSERERELAGLDPRGAMLRLAESFDLADGDRKDLRKSAGTFVASGRGLDLANQITRSAQSLKSLDRAELEKYEAAFREGGGSFADMVNESGGTDLEKLRIKRGFSMLSSTGMLDAFMMEDSEKKQELISKNLASLQESGISLEDVTERKMQLSGKLTIDGSLGDLSATGSE